MTDPKRPITVSQLYRPKLADDLGHVLSSALADLGCHHNWRFDLCADRRLRPRAFLP